MKTLVLLAGLVFAGCHASAGVSTSSEPVPTMPAPQWVPLADGYSATTPSQQIDLRGRGEFARLRIQGTSGTPVIKQITIDYSDSEPAQVVRIDEQLAPGQVRDIDLNGGRRPVKRIIVYAEPQSSGQYTVFGV